jgi:hypothetical protein
LTYGIVAWGNTYYSSINPLFILKKKVVRLLTFSDYTTGSPSSAYVAFVRVCMGIFEDSVFCKNA